MLGGMSDIARRRIRSLWTCFQSRARRGSVSSGGGRECSAVLFARAKPAARSQSLKDVGLGWRLRWHPLRWCRWRDGDNLTGLTVAPKLGTRWVTLAQ